MAIHSEATVTYCRLHVSVMKSLHITQPYPQMDDTFMTNSYQTSSKHDRGDRIKEFYYSLIG